MAEAVMTEWMPGLFDLLIFGMIFVVVGVVVIVGVIWLIKQRK